MSQMSSTHPAERRLRILRFGLTLLPVLTFAIVTGLWAVASIGTDLGGAALQGAIWGAGAALVSVIIYIVYKSMIVKA